MKQKRNFELPQQPCVTENHAHAIVQDLNQYQILFTIGTGILGDHLIGSCVLPQKLSVEAYLNFFEHVLPFILECIPSLLCTNFWFIHDGVPPHFIPQVRDYQDIIYPNRWIGLEGPTTFTFGVK